MTATSFRVGDPVWAKMKGFSPWPGKICYPPADVKRPAIKKTMHCVNFFGTNDFAWIEEFNIKDYKQFKDTFTKSKQSKGMSQAVEQIEKYLKSGDAEATTNSADDNEEFDALVSDPPPAAEKKAARKSVTKKTESRKREANDSDSSASGPSSTSPSKRVRTSKTQVKERKEEPSSSLADRDSPVPSYTVKKSNSAVSGLLDRPALARPASPTTGIDLVTSSQTLREKDIQPSKLSFGFLGLGIMGSVSDYVTLFSRILLLTALFILTQKFIRIMLSTLFDII